MSKKNIQIAVAGAFLLIIVGVCYAGYEYWRKGTPEYSFQELRRDFGSHDVEGANSFIDLNSVSDNEWPRIKTKLSSGQSVIAELALTNQENNFKDLIKNTFYDSERGNVDQTIPVASVIGKFIGTEDPKFSVQNDVATLPLKYQESNNDLAYQFDFIFHKQADRTWKLTDIQGLEDLLAGSSYDMTRVKNLELLAGNLNVYANVSMQEDICHCTAFNCPCVQKFNSDQRPYPKAESYDQLIGFLKSWNPKKGYAYALQNDPLSRYGNSYFYGTNDKTNPTEYVLKATLSDKNSALFENNDSLIFSHILPEGAYDGVSCQRPAYCVGSANIFRRLGIPLTN